MTNTLEQQEIGSEQGSIQDISLLDKVIGVTKQTDADYTKELLKTLTEEALKGVVVWDKNLTNTINKATALIDLSISNQVSEILHNSAFQKLEGSWRGLNYLVKNTPGNNNIKIKVLNIDKKALYKNFDKSVEFDQSDLFKKIYEEEYGTAGGAPYGVLLGDYEFSDHPEDVQLLKYISEVSAASFAPFISAASSTLFGLDSWEDMAKPSDLARIFDSPKYAAWNGYRKTEESRFVCLTLPRTLARLPYGKSTSVIDTFDYEEVELTSSGTAKKVPHINYCWMNSAYVYGQVLTRAFSEYGWCTAIRGVENGGKVDGLPLHLFLSDDGDLDLACPTEIGITDRREAELSKLGFLPLCHYKNEDYSVFFGAQSTNLPQLYDEADATANAAIAARIPYILATARIAHYLKVIARDKIGSFMEVSDVESWLNKWIANYINSNPDSGQALKARFPLAEAKISVEEVAGKPGSYSAVAWLRPWLQLEELTTSLRLVAKIPQ
jgi:type VI secretion system protein ImpC